MKGRVDQYRSILFPVKNVHFLDDYTLQAELAQEEGDRLTVEQLKADLLDKRELAQ